MGLPLPSALSFGCRYVHDASVCIAHCPMLGVWTDRLDHLVHLAVAFILAVPIGWNRARAERSAGLRTFPLVAMASCGLVQGSPSSGPARQVKRTSCRASSLASASLGRAPSSDRVISQPAMPPRPAFGLWAS